MHEEPVRVIAYAGGRGEERPRAFFPGEERVEVGGGGAAVRANGLGGGPGGGGEKAVLQGEGQRRLRAPALLGREAEGLVPPHRQDASLQDLITGESSIMTELNGSTPGWRNW